LVRLDSGGPDRAPELCSKVRARLFLRHIFQLCDVIRCPATKCRIGHPNLPELRQNFQNAAPFEKFPSTLGGALTHCWVGTIPILVPKSPCCVCVCELRMFRKGRTPRIV